MISGILQHKQQSVGRNDIWNTAYKQQSVGRNDIWNTATYTAISRKKWYVSHRQTGSQEHFQNTKLCVLQMIFKEKGKFLNTYVLYNRYTLNLKLKEKIKFSIK